MQIVPSKQTLYTHYSTGEIIDLPMITISILLEFDPNYRCEDKIGWIANVDGEYIAIWIAEEKQRYRRYQTFGNAATFEKLFGNAYCSYENGWR